MENAADALKLAFGIVVFILALTLLFRTATIARETATALITEADKTTYYTYINEDNQLETNKYGEAEVVTRIVTLEDVLPTVYRYSIESYGVTIIDDKTTKAGEEVVTRFEKETENLCSTYERSTYEAKQSIINEINTYVIEPLKDKYNVNIITNEDELLKLFKRIYGQSKTRR